MSDSVQPSSSIKKVLYRCATCGEVSHIYPWESGPDACVKCRNMRNPDLAELDVLRKNIINNLQQTLVAPLPPARAEYQQAIELQRILLENTFPPRTPYYVAVPKKVYTVVAHTIEMLDILINDFISEDPKRELVSVTAYAKGDVDGVLDAWYSTVMYTERLE